MWMVYQKIMSLHFLHLLVDMPEDKATFRQTKNRFLKAVKVKNKQSAKWNCTSETRRGLYTLLLGWSRTEPRSYWGYIHSLLSSRNGRATSPLLCEAETQSKSTLVSSKQTEANTVFLGLMINDFIYSQFKKHPAVYLRLEEYCGYIF